MGGGGLVSLSGGIISLLLDSAIAARWKFVSGKIVIVKMHQNAQSHRFFDSPLWQWVVREKGALAGCYLVWG